MKGNIVMARVARGKVVLEQAKDLLVNSRTIEELRQAQAVVLPLDLPSLSPDFSLTTIVFRFTGSLARTFIV
ncbi:hypothetical protein [Nitrosomonas sp. Nm132]|jgi:hypothetical protein|uniref:hypothetical protein n=1 Tax=Nitrosomonas sp. Nm132 TaxID=1881053 RepID=UPI00088284CB|nr:hypothetical protein [Nitrosomonas sp. Nm132]SDH99806.1 hypothetical protein SAMN05428952_10561 [Nitrosomonas sp. Nm132]